MAKGKKSGKTGKKGPRGWGADALKNSLIDQLDALWDPSEATEEAENNKFGPTEPILGLGNDWELVASPGGPVDPWDCERWPGSPYCGGGWAPDDWAGVGLGDIAVDGCGIMVSIQWSVLGFEMPIVSFGIQSTDPACQPKEEEEEEPPGGGGGGGGGGESLSSVSFPRFNADYLYALTFQQETGIDSRPYEYFTYIVWGPVSLQPGEIRYHSYTGPDGEPLIWGRVYYLNCVGFSAEDGAMGGPREGTWFLPGGDSRFRIYDGLAWPRLVPIRDAQGNDTGTWETLGPAFGLNTFTGDFLRTKKLTATRNDGLYQLNSLDPSKIFLVRQEVIGCFGFYADWYREAMKSYLEGEHSAWGRSYDKDEWEAEWAKIAPPIHSPELARFGGGGRCSLPNPPTEQKWFGGLEKVRYKIRRERIMDKCCEITLANYRMLKRIYAVIAPEELRKFTPSGDPTGKPVCTIPSYFLYPDAGDIPAYIDHYPRLFQAMLLMMDKNAFIPFDVQIPDVSAGQKGNQPLNLRFTNFSAALKELLQLLIDTESDVDDGNNIAVRQSYELMVMHQLLVKIYCLVEGSADYLGYEMQQKVEKVPMMFTADPTKQKKTNKKLDNNTEEAVESLMPQLLQVSEQPVVVERNVQSKDLNETLLEILNLLQARNAGYTQKA